jgi:hypothetical protein
MQPGFAGSGGKCWLQVLMPPISGRRVVDFGLGLGRRTCYLYNLPEVFSANEYMKVGGALLFDMLFAASVSMCDCQQPVTLSHCNRSKFAMPDWTKDYL